MWKVQDQYECSRRVVPEGFWVIMKCGGHYSWLWGQIAGVQTPDNHLVATWPGNDCCTTSSLPHPNSAFSFLGESDSQNSCQIQCVYMCIRHLAHCLEYRVCKIYVFFILSNVCLFENEDTEVQKWKNDYQLVAGLRFTAVANFIDKNR